MNIRELAGREIDEYKLVEIIGSGGMSAVYRGYQEELDRYVAVKILSDALAHQPDYLQRFTVEAKMSASLEHPHIVPVYDFGLQSDLTYVVMRLLQTTLSERNASDDNRLNIPEFLIMAEGVAKALDYAHSRGIIHRDVKPSNIMFDAQGTAYLVDFGIAKAVQSDLNLTAENIVMGTPSYMSPEQWRDDNTSPKSDQYSLAVVLFQTLTGILPFNAGTSSQMMYMHLNEAPPDVTSLNPYLPQAINAIIQRAMSKEPNKRYPTVSNFIKALNAALTANPANAQTVLHQPVVQIPDAPEFDDDMTLEHEAISVDESMEATFQSPAISSEATMQNPALSGADETYQNMPVAAPKPMPTAAPVPRITPKSAPLRKQSAKPDTMIMQVAQGGILGLAALLTIVIIIVIALLFFFAPKPPNSNNNEETNAIPTQAEQSVNEPTTLPQIAVTGRGDATPTVVLGGPIITPAVGIVGMDAAQARQVALLLPVDPVPVRDAAYSPDGVMVAAGDGAGNVKLWRDGVNSNATTLTGHTDVVSAIAFNPDGTLLASAGRDTTIRLWDTSSGNSVSVLGGHTGAIRDIAFSPDGTLLASGAEDGTLRLWDISTGQPIRSINADSTRVLSVAFSPEGQTVASGGRTGLVRLWNPGTGAEISNLTGHSEEVRSVAFSPDGQFIASSSTDNTAIIWRRDNGQRAQTLTLANDIFAVTFSPDSTILATGGRDNNLRLWNVASGQEIKNLTGHQGWVLGVSFAPDGASLITGSGDGSVRIWSAN